MVDFAKASQHAHLPSSFNAFSQSHAQRLVKKRRFLKYYGCLLFFCAAIQFISFIGASFSLQSK